MTKRMILAYVHDPPAKQTIDTRWREPNFLFEQGFTDFVIADQLTGCSSLVMDEADDKISIPALTALDQRLQNTLEAGLKAWVMEDLFTLSKEVAESTSGCPHDEQTWQAISTNLQALFERFPDLQGIIFRFGESFDTEPWANRVDPFSCQCKICDNYGKVGALQRIISELEEHVCEQLGMYCIIRMWDLGEEGIHADSEQQSAAFSKYNENPRLVVSVKHTATDYWRHQPWNNSIQLDGPPRMIEFQCEREYEFLGLVPNWLGHHWSTGFPEVDSLKTAGLANSLPPNWAGSYIIPRGGGWSADVASDDFWSAINSYAIIALTREPKRSADEILDAFLLKQGFEDDASRHSFASLIQMSSDLVLHLRYLPTFQNLANQLWMPSHNWIRDDTFVPGACAHIANLVAKEDKTELFQDERSFASIVARTQLARAEALFDGGPFADHPKAGFILDSYEWARKFAELSEEIWNKLLASTPLTREKTKTIIESELTNNPLPPLRCLE